MNCPKCKSSLLEKNPGSENEYHCIMCGFIYYPEIIAKLPSKAQALQKPDDNDTEKKEPHLTKEQVQKRWRNSPAGKASIQRYQKSELFRAAHARHRKTEKYKASQKKFKDKKKKMKKILDILECEHTKGFIWNGDDDFRCKVCNKKLEEVF